MSLSSFGESRSSAGSAFHASLIPAVWSSNCAIEMLSPFGYVGKNRDRWSSSDSRPSETSVRTVAVVKVFVIDPMRNTSFG